MPKVFVCYSRRDRRWVVNPPGSLDPAFVPWLRDSLRRSNIDVWWDAELDKSVGEAYDRRIAEAIATSDMAMLLVSDDFFISEYIADKELPAIRERVEKGEMLLFPIVVGHIADWEQSEESIWLYSRHIHPAAITPLAEIAESPARWGKVRSELCAAVRRQLVPSAAPAAPPSAERRAIDPGPVEIPQIATPPVEPPKPPTPPRLEPSAAPRPGFGAAARLEALRRREEAAQQAAKALLADATEAFRTCMETDALKSVTAEEKAVAWEEYLQHFASTGYEVEKARTRIGFWRPIPGEPHTLDLGGGVRMHFRWCPPGRFTMGSPEAEGGRKSDEGPVQVTLTKGFWMGETPVTQAQYQQVMGSNPANFCGDSLPVEPVTWDKAMEFCRKLSSASGLPLSLPTEAQWEYACRAGTATPFHFGATITTDQANYDRNPGYAPAGVYRPTTTPVGSFPANNWGLQDMHGNVWEWCADWYGGKLVGGADPTGPASGSRRVLRGGNWYCKAGDCRSASRSALEPGDLCQAIGFRVFLSVE